MQEATSSRKGALSRIQASKASILKKYKKDNLKYTE